MARETGSETTEGRNIRKTRQKHQEELQLSNKPLAEVASEPAVNPSQTDDEPPDFEDLEHPVWDLLRTWIRSYVAKARRNRYLLVREESDIEIEDLPEPEVRELLQLARKDMCAKVDAVTYLVVSRMMDSMGAPETVEWVRAFLELQRPGGNWNDAPSAQFLVSFSGDGDFSLFARDLSDLDFRDIADINMYQYLHVYTRSGKISARDRKQILRHIEYDLTFDDEDFELDFEHERSREGPDILTIEVFRPEEEVSDLRLSCALGLVWDLDLPLPRHSDLRKMAERMADW